MRGVKLAAHKPVVHSTTFYSKRWNGYNWCHHPTLPSPPPPPPPLSPMSGPAPFKSCTSIGEGTQRGVMAVDGQNGP